MKPHAHLPAEFAQFGLDVALLRGLDKAQFVTPTEIQREMIPLILEGKDVLGQAQTGTGKTAAYSLPLLHRLDPLGGLQVAILVPTRELAVQVTAEIRRLAEFTPIQIVPIYGGQAIMHQVKVLGRRTQMIVATPGRLLDLLGRRIIDLGPVRYAVLDEVDRMLDIGFIDDIRRLLGKITQAHQTVFVSATISREVTQLAKQFMNQPVEVNVSHDDLTVETIDQVYCSVEPWDKFGLLKLLMEQEKPKLAIVFTNTKHGARKLAKKLHAININVKEIHGDLVQSKREKVMERFRRHKIDVLVATDLASRGIDVHNITHIINYDMPPDPQVYVHRVGRTARMGAFGRAVTFVTREEGSYLTSVEMLINKQIKEVKYDGFAASPSREPRPEARAQGISRAHAPVFAAPTPSSPTATTMPRKTLGSKFRPHRKRR